MTRPSETEVVMVLGMHRSGTSLVAQALGVLYGEVGEDLLPAQPDNPEGYFEDRDFYAFNERLLRQAGASWQDVGRLVNCGFSGPSWAPLYQEGARLLEDRLRRHPVFVVKDPRFCVLLPFYRRLLQDLALPVRTVLVHRHPRNVASSLQRRNLLDPDYGLQLWVAHNYLALRELAAGGLPWPVFVSYERFMAEPAAQLGRLLGALGAGHRVSTEAVEGFVRGHLRRDLQHHRAPITDALDDIPVPSWLRRLHDLLQSAEAAGPRELRERVAHLADDADLRWYFSVMNQRDNLLQTAYQVHEQAQREVRRFLGYRLALAGGLLQIHERAEAAPEVVFYGAGSLFRILVRMLRRPVACVVDGGQSLQGREVEGHRVQPVRALLDHPQALVVVTPIGDRERIGAVLDALDVGERLYLEDLLGDHPG